MRQCVIKDMVYACMWANIAVSSGNENAVGYRSVGNEMTFTNNSAE